MNWDSVRNAFSWTGPGGAVTFAMQNQDNIYSFTPEQPLSYDAQYTVAFAANTAADWSNNHLAAASWSFTMTAVDDNTAPTIVSTVPANGATNVSLNVTLQITFSEPVDPNSMGNDAIMISPDMGNGVPTWSNGGKTINFDPYLPLSPNTTYSLTAIQGGVKDLAGNGLAESYSLTFSTGATLPTGQFSGTISGDQSSTQAADPDYWYETNLSSYSDYTFHEFDGLAEGTYYAGAYLDVNYSHAYEPGIDPAGFYAVGGAWATVTVQNGEDGVNVDIRLDDPVPGTPPSLSSGTPWVTHASNRQTGNSILHRLLRTAAELAALQRGAR